MPAHITMSRLRRRTLNGLGRLGISVVPRGQTNCNGRIAHAMLMMQRQVRDQVFGKEYWSPRAFGRELLPRVEQRRAF